MIHCRHFDAIFACRRFRRRIFYFRLSLAARLFTRLKMSLLCLFSLLIFHYCLPPAIATHAAAAIFVATLPRAMPRRHYAAARLLFTRVFALYDAASVATL